MGGGRCADVGNFIQGGSTGRTPLRLGDMGGETLCRAEYERLASQGGPLSDMQETS